MDPTQLSAEETATLIDYVRRKYAEERSPLSRELRPVQEAIGKLRGKPEPLPPTKPHVPSLYVQRQEAAVRL
jgi:hypothetical protein